MLSYTQQTLEDEWDVIVIGSGIGGLATAALLSRHAGKKVLVLERHYTAGGFTHSLQSPWLHLGRRGALHRRGAGSAFARARRV